MISAMSLSFTVSHISSVVGPARIESWNLSRLVSPSRLLLYRFGQVIRRREPPPAGTHGDHAESDSVRAFGCDLGWLTLPGYRLSSGGGGSPALTRIARCGRAPRLNWGYRSATHDSIGPSDNEHADRPATATSVAGRKGLPSVPQNGS